MGAVSGGKDVRIGGAQLVVHRDALRPRQVGPGQELHVGGHPDGEEHRLAGEFPAVVQGEGADPARLAPDGLGPGMVNNLDPHAG